MIRTYSTFFGIGFINSHLGLLGLLINSHLGLLFLFVHLYFLKSRFGNGLIVWNLGLLILNRDLLLDILALLDRASFVCNQSCVSRNNICWNLIYPVMMCIISHYKLIIVLSFELEFRNIVMLSLTWICIIMGNCS